MSAKQKAKQDQLAELSGRRFDLAYMQYMLLDHSQDVKEFEQTAQGMQDQEMKQWASRTLPILKQHLNLAFNVATALGPMNLFSEETTPVPGAN